MSRRHTLTSPEERTMPRNGRSRCAVRMAFVSSVTDDKTGELVYEEIRDDDGEIIQKRACRKVRRSVAFGTRLHNNGSTWKQSRDALVKPRAFVPREVTA